MNTKHALRVFLVIATIWVCQAVDTSESFFTAETALAARGSDEVVLFSTSWCGYCRKAREYLVSNGIPHEELDIEKSIEGKQEFAALGGRGVPLILVGNEQIRGWNPAALNTALARVGLAPSGSRSRGAKKKSAPLPPINYDDLDMSYVSIITPSSDSEHRYTIHLRDERTISTDEYWEEGEQIMYEKFGGVVGVERRDVVKIDDTKSGTTRRLK